MCVFQLYTRKSGQEAQHRSKKMLWPGAGCQDTKDAKCYFVNDIWVDHASAYGNPMNHLC